MNTIDITVSEGTGLKDPPKEFSLKFIDQVLEYLGISNKEISIVLTDDDSIAKLNETYRDIKGPTDVLTFCQQQDEIAGFNSFNQPENLGDIIISLDTLKRNSNYFKVNYKEEMERVLIHGILHLIGMHHETNNDDEEMIILQEKILKKITENFFETEYFC